MTKQLSQFAPAEVSALSKEEAAGYLTKMSVDQINALPESILKAMPAGTGELLKKSAIDVGELKVKTAIGLGSWGLPPFPGGPGV